MRPAIYFSPRFGDHHPRHATRHAHPDNHARYLALRAAVDVAMASGRFTSPEAPAFEVAWAHRVHEATYLDRLAALRGVEHARLDDDTGVSSGSILATETAAASLCHAVEAAWAGEQPSAFVLCRPPGHHARPGAAMGFCLLNHVAIAAAHARSLGTQRVAIIDWDVHLGNGSAEIFSDDPAVLVIDLHQHEHWPAGGAEEEVGTASTTMNFPMPVGSADADFAWIFDRVIEPALNRFEPELVLVSAGFDAHRQDPLGELCLSDRGFAGLCARVHNYAARLCEGRLVLGLEGGYAPQALQSSVEACLRQLSGASGAEARPVDPGVDRVQPQVRALASRARERFGLEG